MTQRFLILCLTLLLSGCFSSSAPAPSTPTRPADLPEETVWFDGTWSRKHLDTAATLVITDSSADRFLFTLSSGSRSLDGWASISGTTASFQQNGCLLTFSAPPDEREAIHVFTEGTCQGDPPLFGTFTHGEPSNPLPPLVSLGVLPSVQADERFRRLVGEDYRLFADRFMIVSDAENLDTFSAVAKSGAVRGLFTIMEAIILYNDSGDFWAAALVDGEVHYFSTVNAYRGRLPLTIDAWRRSFEDAPVVYRTQRFTD